MRKSAFESPVGVAASEPPAVPVRERLFASLIWRHTGLSRRDLHERTNTHPTLTGNAVAALTRRGLVREGAITPAAARGRPQIPLEIDTNRRTFLGIAIAPGGVRAVRVNARGRPLTPEQAVAPKRNQSPIDLAAALLRRHSDESVAAVGVSITGLALPREAKVLFSSSLPSSASMSVAPIYEATRAAVVLHNDVHALAMRWSMGRDEPAGDLLLVGVDDGRLGASLLLGGRPHGGAVCGANELGHTRLAVEADPCYCGQRGCLERIVSTAQLKRFGARSSRTLDAVLADPRGDGPALDRVLECLAIGVSNAVNFMRPDQVIIASPLVRNATFRDALTGRLPPLILPGLRERVSLAFWEQSNVHSAENAAWLALAEVFGRPPGLPE